MKSRLLYYIVFVGFFIGFHISGKIFKNIGQYKILTKRR